jgi:hypothetical protein
MVPRRIFPAWPWTVGRTDAPNLFGDSLFGVENVGERGQTAARDDGETHVAFRSPRRFLHDDGVFVVISR